MHYFKIMAALVLAVILTGACASLKPTSLTDARNSCYTFTGPNDNGSCGVDQTDVCDRFFNGLDQMASYEECEKRCEEVNKNVLLDPVLLGCDDLRQRADWLCRDYCRDNYR